MNLFGNLAPLGYARVTLATQVFQTGIPPAYLSPEVTNGKPVVVMTGPDGAQRPLKVEIAFLQCLRCGAVVLESDIGPASTAPGGGVRIHDAWHTRQEPAHPLHGEGECPPTCELPGPHTAAGP